MLVRIFSVYDSKAEGYLQPFFAPTVGVAERLISDTVADSSHLFSRHAEDYSLFVIGSFDDSTGSLETCERTPELISPLTRYVGMING